MHLLGQREAIDEESLTVLRNGFGLDERFCHIDHEQLAVRSIILMGKAESPAGKKSPLTQSSRRSSAVTQ